MSAPISDDELFVIRNCLAAEGPRFRMGPLDTRAIIARLDATQAALDEAVAARMALQAQVNRSIDNTSRSIKLTDKAIGVGIAEGRRIEREAVVTWLRSQVIEWDADDLAAAIEAGEHTRAQQDAAP